MGLSCKIDVHSVAYALQIASGFVRLHSRHVKLEIGSDSRVSLRWRHNERDGVSNHQPHDCLLNRFFRCRLKKMSTLHITGLCEGNSLVTGEFPQKGAVTQKMFPFDDVIRVSYSTMVGSRIGTKLSLNYFWPHQDKISNIFSKAFSTCRTSAWSHGHRVVYDTKRCKRVLNSEAHRKRCNCINNLLLKINAFIWYIYSAGPDTS